MQIVLHTGAHLTDEDRLINCLMKNSSLFQQHGANIPRPAGYRKLIRTAMNDTSPFSASSTFSEVQKAVIGSSKADRHVISNSGFFGTEKMCFGSGELYRSAETRIGAIKNLFANDQLEMFMAIRNPASFLPLIFYNYHDSSTQERLLGDNLHSVRWSDFFVRIRQAFPDLPLTVWCNEDTPLIWSQVIREMTQIDSTVAFEGEFALMHEILSEGGLKQFQTFMEGHDGLTEVQTQRAIVAFIEKFAREDALEDELKLPGWSQELTEQMTELYDADLDRISEIPNLKIIQPI